jgi:hypothetical protein
MVLLQWSATQQLAAWDAIPFSDPSPLADGTGSHSAERRCLPFLSAQDLLRAFHILRC